MTTLSAPVIPPTAEGPATAVDVLDALARNGGSGRHLRAPLPTGYVPLDAVLQGGLRPGNLTLLAGKPGQGKTIAALQWARHLACSGTPVVFACFEHDTTTLLTRLLALELGEASAGAGEDDQLRLEVLRERLATITDAGDVGALLASDPLLAQVEARLRSYGPRLLLVDSSTAGGLDALEALVEQGGPRVALFVDYLQKVPLRHGSRHETESVTVVAEQLKAMALRHTAAVVAITASGQEGLASRRLHLHHSRGAAALAYEADVAIVMNDKLSVVSRVHLAYDTTKVYDFADRVVFSVEKNRNGLADVHLEFRKDFSSYRFHPRGDWVTERLWVEDGLES